jgi:signal transduction histidine kinase
MTRFLPLFGRRGSRWLVAAVSVSAAVLVWTGYRAIEEWEQAAAQVASRRAEAAANLLVAALARDMRGVQQLMLTSAERDGLTAGPDPDLVRPIGNALERYPYPEVFFAWQSAATPESVLFYSRPERRPLWLATAPPRRMFPVVAGHEPIMAAHLIDRVMKDGREGRRFSVFDLKADMPYQVVAFVSYADALRERPTSVLGFMVNLEWARQHYFADLVAQVARIEGSDHAIQFSLIDERGTAVVGGEADRGGAPARRETFPLAFFDPLIVAVDPPADLRIASWTAVASAARDPTLAAAERGARRTLGVAAVMAIALTVGLWLSVEAGRASETLADMRADFVSAVTHELKTPIANMRAIHETLASGRATLDMSREYAQMGIREANRLARLVDNLLAYARITDVAHAYAFESVALETIVDRSVKEFASNLAHGDFDVHIELPDGLPPVKGDPTALNLTLNNLLDNAIRYSKDRRHLTITGRLHGRTVELEVSDKGVGIPESDLQRVTRKFWRGPGSHAGGSGLGLAIVDRIVADHGGTLEIRSTVGVGTSVLVTLPVADGGALPTARLEARDGADTAEQGGGSPLTL